MTQDPANRFHEAPVEPDGTEEVPAGSVEPDVAEPEHPAPDEQTDEELAALAEAGVTRAQEEVATLTADLQRLQAEFLNYKRRVDRDRDLIRENAKYAVLAPIIDVLDTIDRAREHGPLEDGLKAVAEQLERAVSGLGLGKFGAPGDPFDPRLHEALSHIGEDPEVDVTTCKVIAKAGYRMGDRVVRAAQVLVVDPVSGQPEAPAGEPADQPAEGPSDDA